MEEPPISFHPDSRPMGRDETGRCLIYELSDGQFAIIGIDATQLLDPELPPDAARAEHERTVVIPRGALLDARNDIPDE